MRTFKLFFNIFYNDKFSKTIDEETNNNNAFNNKGKNYLETCVVSRIWIERS